MTGRRLLGCNGVREVLMYVMQGFSQVILETRVTSIILDDKGCMEI